jgi:hypothetical protein
MRTSDTAYLRAVRAPAARHDQSLTGGRGSRAPGRGVSSDRQRGPPGWGAEGSRPTGPGWLIHCTANPGCTVTKPLCSPARSSLSNTPHPPNSISLSQFSVTYLPLLTATYRSHNNSYTSHVATAINQKQNKTVATPMGCSRQGSEWGGGVKPVAWMRMMGAESVEYHRRTVLETGR